MLLLVFASSGLRAAERTFTSPVALVVSDNTSASPYPSVIAVSGLPEVVDKVSITISNISHLYPEDLDILLVGPGGQAVILLSDGGAGRPNHTFSVSNLTVTFDDLAPVAVRDFGQLTSGVFRTADYAPADGFGPNAPPGPYGNSLAVFKESVPNGEWKLYVVDDQAGGGGNIGGWSLTIWSHSRLFSNTNAIVLGQNAAIATPYPSSIQIQEALGPITKATVTLVDLHHPNPSDMDLLLVGPGGEAVVLMSDAGGSSAVTKATLTFDDSAILVPPANAALSSGRFRPVNYPDPETFPQPAPAAPYGVALSVFEGKSATGTWQLFLLDDNPATNPGHIAGGWRLALSTEPLAIIQQPVSVTVPPGGSATLSVSAAGVEPLTYQWRLNNVPIPGATAPSLHLSQVGVADAGSYSVSVENAYGLVHSDSALVLLNAPLAPAPDHFAQRQVLSGLSGGVLGTNFFKTREPGEPNHAGKQGGASVWYAWTAPSSGIATFDTRGSTFDTLLGIYTGTNVDKLTLVARDEDNGGFFTSVARFNATGGQTYLIAVDGLTDEHGFFNLNWHLEVTNDLLPVLGPPKAGHTVSPGDSAILSVTATGQNLKYRWFRNGLEIPNGSASSIAITDVGVDDVGTYQLEARAGARKILSEPILLEIGPVLDIQSRAKKKDLFLTAQAFFSMARAMSSASAEGGPFVSVRAGTSSGLQIIHSFGGATARGTCDPAFRRTRYLGLRAEDDGEFIVHTTGSNVRTVLEVHRVIDPFGTTRCLDRSEGSPSVVRFHGTSGSRYIIQAAPAHREAEGAIQIHWSFGVHLSVARDGPRHARLTWRSALHAYQLQATHAATMPAGAAWESVPYPVVFIPPDTNSVTVPLDGSAPGWGSNRLFRLVRP